MNHSDINTCVQAMILRRDWMPSIGQNENNGILVVFMDSVAMTSTVSQEWLQGWIFRKFGLEKEIQALRKSFLKSKDDKRVVPIAVYHDKTTGDGQFSVGEFTIEGM